MGLSINDLGRDEKIPARIQPAVQMLLEASEYARRTTGNCWEFAVEIQELRDLGLSPNDLRFLVRAQVVEHASEITIASENGRQFQPTGDLTFTDRTCFVLKTNGHIASGDASEVQSNDDESLRIEVRESAELDASRISRRPSWDAETRILRFGEQVVKRFKYHAANQEMVLAAFEEDGWPHRIDDPLPPRAEQDSKRRLSDTIKCLNRKQENAIIHFRGDGTGEGAIWELVETYDSNGEDLGSKRKRS